MGRVKGIDISVWNGVLDWSKVKAAGIKFVIIRAGYGKTVDECFSANAKGAIAAGIPIGVYWFSYALNAAGAKQEAQKCIQTIKGLKITLPVFFDFEYDTVAYAKKQGVTLGKQAFNDHSVAFCETVKAAGYKAGVYYNLDYYQRMVDKSRLKDYVQWYAQYNSTADISGYDFWQYSSSGTISGISGRFDMNTADESIINGSTTKAGWVKDSKGKWYRNADGTWPASVWKKISGKWYYFGSDGYCVVSQWQWYKGNLYYLGADGVMVTDKSVMIDNNGKMVAV